MKIAPSTASVLCLVFASSLPAQQPAGMSNEWDVHKTLESMAHHLEQIAPLVDQANPREWMANGAPETYIAQWNSCRSGVKAVVYDLRKLSRNPEKLTDSLEALFRVRALEALLGSFSDGLRKYHNPPMADMLNAVIAQNGADRDRLQQYVLELAVEKEQAFRVADEEAQRCRGSIARQPSRDRATPVKPGRN